MSPILGIIASSKFAAVGDFESIATVTVGSGGAATITFSSIPATYTHLQIRIINRGETTLARTSIRFNGDSGTNYTQHIIGADGATVYAFSGTSQTYSEIGVTPDSGATANAYASFIVDILDYSNSNKNKTIRTLSGYDANGSGWIALNSGLWINSNAITSITLQAGGIGSGDFNQYSHFALYGIKSA